MNLDELRKRIDEIDSELRLLLRERMQISQAIGRYKFKNKIEIENKEREKDILKIEGSFSKEIKAVYQTILQESRNIQKHDFLLIGKKLNYSLSPLIYKLYGLDNYQLWETNFFSEVVPLNYKGINITNPFKHDAFKYCTEVSDIARKLASVNLIIKDGNNLYGDNTDYYGFIKTLEYFQIDVKGKRALIIGNGATAKMIAEALKAQKAKSITFLVREVRSALEVSLKEYQDYQEYELLINATPYGMKEQDLLFPLKGFKNLEAVIDVIYNPRLTPLLQEARKMDIKNVNGLFMLVAQAAQAASYFLKENQEKKIEAVYRKLLMNKVNIVLIGMPFAGKTHLGEELSNMLDKSFVDIDYELAKTKDDLASVINNKGLAYFREKEASLTLRIAEGENQVIACGGGIVLNEAVMLSLKRKGIIIFLNTSYNKLRLRLDRSRPLIQSEADLKEIYEERANLYQKYADIIINDDEEIAEITVKINEYFSNKWTKS